MIGYAAIGVLLAIAVAFGTGYHYGGKGPREELAAFRADVKAKGIAKENENARIQAQANAAAAAAGVDAQFARIAADRTAEERDAAMRRLGGVVRDLDDARRVLSAGSGRGAPTADSPAVVRGDAADPGADLAGRLAACEHGLTVSTATASVNKLFHERALIARDACVRQYNEVRALYNEGE